MKKFCKIVVMWVILLAVPCSAIPYGSYNGDTIVRCEGSSPVVEIDKVFLCDGYNDCPQDANGIYWDEDNCNCPDRLNPDPWNWFECGNTMCIPIAARCDGVQDCPDNTDELGCQTTTKSTTPKTTTTTKPTTITTTTTPKQLTTTMTTSSSTTDEDLFFTESLLVNPDKSTDESDDYNSLEAPKENEGQNGIAKPKPTNSRETSEEYVDDDDSEEGSTTYKGSGRPHFTWDMEGSGDEYGSGEVDGSGNEEFIPSISNRETRGVGSNIDVLDSQRLLKLENTMQQLKDRVQELTDSAKKGEQAMSKLQEDMTHLIQLLLRKRSN